MTFRSRTKITNVFEKKVSSFIALSELLSFESYIHKTAELHRRELNSKLNESSIQSAFKSIPSNRSFRNNMQLFHVDVFFLIF